MKKIPYSRQSIDASDLAAVEAALKSDFLTQGPLIEEFEREFARIHGVPHAVAVCNATAALHIAYQALGIGAGKLVWTSPNTFVATSNAALYLDATVDFVDIDPRTYNLSVDALKAKLTATRQAGGRLPDLVVPVHFGGQSCDMQGLARLAAEFGFRVVEDASHAVGAVTQGEPVGSCAHSDAAIFSFHPVKIITTGEGGLITTRNAELAAHLRRLRAHGITRDAALMTEPSHGTWYYQQLELGWNFRLTELQSALGLSQLKRLSAFRERREAKARRYDELLKDLPLKLHGLRAGENSARHLYVVRVDRARVKKDKRKIFEELHQRGVLVNLHYMPVYLQPYYASLGFKPGLCPEAEAYYAEAITLPLFVDMTDADQDQVVAALRDVLV